MLLLKIICYFKITCVSSPPFDIRKSLIYGVCMSIVVNTPFPILAGSPLALGAVQNAAVETMPTPAPESTAGEFVPPSRNGITRRDFSKLLVAGSLGLLLSRPAASHAVEQETKETPPQEEPTTWKTAVGLLWGGLTVGYAAACGDLVVRPLPEYFAVQPLKKMSAFFLNWAKKWLPFYLGFNTLWIFIDVPVNGYGNRFISRKKLSPGLDQWFKDFFALGLFGTFETACRLFSMDWRDVGQPRFQRALGADYFIHILKTQVGTLLCRAAKNITLKNSPNKKIHVASRSFYPMLYQAWLTYRQIKHRDR